jgi:hypothetical protein
MLKDVKIVTDAGRFFTKQGWPGSQSAKLKKTMSQILIIFLIITGRLVEKS